MLQPHLREACRGTPTPPNRLHWGYFGATSGSPQMRGPCQSARIGQPQMRVIEMKVKPYMGKWAEKGVRSGLVKRGRGLHPKKPPGRSGFSRFLILITIFPSPHKACLVPLHIPGVKKIPVPRLFHLKSGMLSLTPSSKWIWSRFRRRYCLLIKKEAWASFFINSLAYCSPSSACLFPFDFPAPTAWLLQSGPQNPSSSCWRFSPCYRPAFAAACPHPQNA